MKKTIFLMTFILVMIVSVFAISVNAETIVSEENLDENGDVMADSLGEYTIDGLAQNVSSIDITYTDINGETKSGKMYFVTNLWDSKRQMHSTYIPADFDMSQMVYMPDKVDTNGDGSFAYSEKIVGTQGSKNLYYSYDSYSEGEFTNLVDIKNQLTKLCYSTYLEYFGPNAYNKIPLVTVTHSGKEAVEGTFFVSPRVTQFYGGTTSSSFGGSANGNINGETGKFTRLVFEERTNSLSFGQYCFCRNIIEEVVFLGTGTYNLGSDAIAYLWKEGTNEPCLNRVVIQDGVKFSGTISLNVGTYDIVFIGAESNYSYDNYSSVLTNATDTVTYEELCYVYGHEAEDDDHNCATSLDCIYSEDGCEYKYVEAIEHTIKQEIIYDKGLLFAGCINEICQNDNCEYASKIEDTEPLFVMNGYSHASAPTGAIMQSFQINKDAIEKYEEFSGKTVEYGILAASGAVQNIYTGGFNDKVVSVDFTNREYDIMEMKIYGITTATKDTALYCCGYIMVDGDIIYMDKNMSSEASLPTTVTYAGLGGTFVAEASLDAVVPTKEEMAA